MITLETVAAYVTAYTSTFERRMRQASLTLSRFGSDATALGGRVAGVGERLTRGLTVPLLAASGTAAGFAIKAWTEQEDAIRRVEIALRQQGVSVARYLPGLEKLSDNIQKYTVYSDDAVLAAAAFGLNMGVQADQIDNVTKAAVGLSAQYGMELGMAMRLIALGLRGNTSLLMRYGIVVSKTLSPQQKAKAILEQGAKAFQAAREQATTTSGRMAIFRNTVNEMQEAVGKFLVEGLELPALFDRMTRKVQALTEKFNTIPLGVKKFAGTLLLIAIAAGPVIYALGRIIQSFGFVAKAIGFLLKGPGKALAGMALPIIAVGLALAGVAAAILSIIGKGDTLKERMTSGAEAIRSKWVSMVDTVVVRFEGWKTFATNMFNEMTVRARYTAEAFERFFGIGFENIGIAWYNLVAMIQNNGTDLIPFRDILQEYGDLADRMQAELVGLGLVADVTIKKTAKSVTDAVAVVKAAQKSAGAAAERGSVEAYKIEISGRSSGMDAVEKNTRDSAAVAKQQLQETKVTNVLLRNWWVGGTTEEVVIIP